MLLERKNKKIKNGSTTMIRTPNAPANKGFRPMRAIRGSKQNSNPNKSCMGLERGQAIYKQENVVRALTASIGSWNAINEHQPLNQLKAIQKILTNSSIFPKQ